MTREDQAVFLNALPLLVLGAVYLVATASLIPVLWRERKSAREAQYALALVFPCGGVAALLFGALIWIQREPLGNHPWIALAAVLVALSPALFFLARWRDRALLVTGARHAREAEEERSAQERRVEAVARLSLEFAHAQDVESVARILLDEIRGLFGVEFAALTLVDLGRREARGLLARRDNEDVGWFREIRIDLDNEPSGVASAVFDAVPFTVYDAESAPSVSRRLVERVGAKSTAYVPLVVEGEVVAVLVLAATRDPRAFAPSDLSFMQALANEGALALERARSATELGEALERERLVSEIARRVRSELDVRAVADTAVREIGHALGGTRCFVRLGEPPEGALKIAAEWVAPGLPMLEPGLAERLPASNLAVREGTTIAIGDVEPARELDAPGIGGRRTLLEIGTRAVLAVPIVVFDQTVGVFAVHRAEARNWTTAEIGLAEAVARELGLALHTARLLGENERRLAHQAGLLTAVQTVASELEPQALLQTLVDRVAQLVQADAADCYLLDGDRGMLRCAAVHGLSQDVVGWELPKDRGASGEAVRDRRAVVATEYDRGNEALLHPAYEGFTHVIVAPMMWSSELRGVLGVGRRDPDQPFSDADVDALTTFASLASLAIRNAETFSDRSRQAQIQRGFYLVASVLGRSLSLSETLDAVAQAASEALGGSCAAVMMPRGRTLGLAGAHDLPGRLRTLLAAGLGESAEALAGAARDRRILAARSLGDDDRLGAPWGALAAECGCHALLAVPIEAPREESAGLVLVFFDESRSFSADDLELAQHLAGATRGALERSDLFENERASRALAQQLARTGGLLATELDPAAVVDEVVQRGPALVSADAGSIWVVQGDELVVTVAVGEGSEAAIGVPAPAAGWLVGDVVQARTAIAVDEVEDERARTLDPLLAAGHSAFLGVPLVGPEGALHGVLAVYGRSARSWRDEEVEALRALAANTSAALSNAELYQRVALEKEQSAAILANIADGIVAVNREGDVVLWNAAAEEITGVPATEALGRAPAHVLQRELSSGLDAPSGDRLVPILKGGEETWLSVTEAIMRDPAGAVAGRIFAFRDISDERLVEQMKSEFVSAVSHELRAPLTSIYGFAQTLLRQDVAFAEEERRTFLGYIASETERLTMIVDALLNVARLDTGDLQVNIIPTDVRELAAEVVALADQNTLEAHRFVLDLPRGPLEAAADPEKLRQVLVQLLDNAVKYSPDGGTVTVSARRKTDTVELAVGDEGIGIASTERDRIFSKFYRGDGPRGRTGGGTGLGLFIVQGLVEAMGGRIHVESAEGHGSTFTFELPAVAALSAARSD